MTTKAQRLEFISRMSFTLMSSQAITITSGKFCEAQQADFVLADSRKEIIRAASLSAKSFIVAVLANHDKNFLQYSHRLTLKIAAVKNSLELWMLSPSLWWVCISTHGSLPLPLCYCRCLGLRFFRLLFFIGPRAHKWTVFISLHIHVFE